MANIFLKPNADIDEIVAKINEDRGTDVTLVFPNGSKLFSDEASLEILKIKTDELGKKIFNESGFLFSWFLLFFAFDKSLYCRGLFLEQFFQS